MNREIQYDSIVIGAGAAGCLAAGRLAAAGQRVLLLERNDRPARKLGITGKGRCNLTNNCTPEEFLREVRQGDRFLLSAIHRFPPQYTMDFFEGLGVPLKTERGRRVFPVSDKASDVVKALTEYARLSGAKLVQGRAEKLLFAVEDGEYRVCGIQADGRSYAGQRVLIATGGMSYPVTGSTGDGYRLAEEAGHTIVEPRPSLVPLVTAPCYPELSGLTLKNITLSLRKTGQKKELFREMGELLFTHFGISGPLTLSASGYITGNPREYDIRLDLKPGLDRQKLDARLLRDFAERSGSNLSTALRGLLPAALIEPVLAQADISGGIRVGQVTKEQRKRLLDVLKEFVLQPVAFRSIEEAVITAGGVSTKEIDPKTMRSRLVENLFFAGEVMDADAFTGGYNLQIAFATAFAAAEAMEKDAAAGKENQA